MTVGELGGRMDAEEFMEWGEWDQIHQSDDWVRTALTCLTMVRLVGNSRATLDDFLPARRKPDRPADPNVGPKVLAWALARVAAQRGELAPEATVR